MSAQLSSGARVDVLGVLDFHARKMARDCKFCADPVCCTDCDLARPTIEARAAVAELVAAATKLVNRPGIAMQCGDDEAQLRAALAAFSEAGR